MKGFRKITLPLAGRASWRVLFVFIPSIGEYITPSLVGGTKGYKFGQASPDHFVGGAFDWQGGSVLRAVPAACGVLFLTATTSKFLRAGRRHGIVRSRLPRSRTKRSRGTGGNVALSRKRRPGADVFFVAFLIFLYVRRCCCRLLVQRLDGAAFPLAGQTTKWYHQAGSS
jgi:hypothetical protein